jgi:hypothetical protein
MIKTEKAAARTEPVKSLAWKLKGRMAVSSSAASSPAKMPKK